MAFCNTNKRSIIYCQVWVWIWNWIFWIFKIWHFWKKFFWHHHHFETKRNLSNPLNPIHPSNPLNPFRRSNPLNPLKTHRTLTLFYHLYTPFENTAINFILTMNLKFECKFEFTKNLRRTEYLFAIYGTSQIWTPIKQKIFK